MNVEQTKDRIAIMQAYVDGKAIQYFHGAQGVWIDVKDPRWDIGTKYRIKQAGPDSFDFSHLGDRFNFVARDSDGEVFAYAKRPERNANAWSASGPQRCIDHLFASYRNNGCDWKDSLLVRPGYQDA